MSIEESIMLDNIIRPKMLIMKQVICYLLFLEAGK